MAKDHDPFPSLQQTILSFSALTLLVKVVP